MYKLNKLLFVYSFSTLIILVIVSGSVDNDYNLFSTAVWTIPSSILVASLYNVKQHFNKINEESLKINENAINKNAQVNKISGKVAKAFVSFGNVTYEFFLIHQLVLRYSSGLLKKLGCSQFILTYGFAFVLSLALANLFHVVLLQKSNAKGC